MNGLMKSNLARMPSAKCLSREDPEMPVCYIYQEVAREIISI